MRKTYVTTMPDHIGAFLKASRAFAELGVNITRVSYNKAIDVHTLFIDAEGTSEQLEKADGRLKEIGYIHSGKNDSSVVLLEFMLRDVPGSVTDVLSLINEFKFNISYISSQENGTDYQQFKMGLYVDDAEKISQFMESAQKLCGVRVIDYDHTEKIFDNSVFYNSFVQALAESASLGGEMRERLLVNTNLAMQTLDEKGTSPYKTFESIGKFGELLAECKGEKFAPRITRHKISENTEIVLIEPPCGSNTAIIKSGGEVLFIDSGYACYREEMQEIFRKELPEYDSITKTVLITHADVDHCGLLPLFDRVLASRKSADCLEAEFDGRKGFREMNALHEPYINICKILTEYQPVEKSKVEALWGVREAQSQPLERIGSFKFGDLDFEVYEGQGGHLPGEIVLIDFSKRIAFTGDIYINIAGLTKQQAEYNRYAPILMTSVDTSPALCSAERKAFYNLLSSGDWQIFGAHGYKKDYTVD